MKLCLFLLFSVVFINNGYGASSLQVDYLNAGIKKGTCDSKVEDWCPTYVEDTRNGFILHAKTNKSLSSISFNYGNLTVSCFMWKMAEGKSNAIAALKVEDNTGNFIFFVRRCE